MPLSKRTLVACIVALMCAAPVGAETTFDAEGSENDIDRLTKLTAERPFDANAWISLGVAYEEAGDWQRAASTFETAVQRFPEHKELYRHIGSLLVKHQKYEDAKRWYQKSIDVGPPDRVCYLNLRWLYNQLGDFDNELAISKQFLEKFPTDHDAAAVRRTVEYQEAEYAKLKAQSTGSLIDTKPSSEEQRYRWPISQMPIKVYIPDAFRYDTLWTASAAPDEFSESTAGQFIERALNEWSGASSGRVRFVLTSDPAQANIECVPTDDTSAMHATYAAGETTGPQNQGGIARRQVRILTVDRSSQKVIEKSKFYEVCLHELGHAIGLDHSSRQEDVMYPNVHYPPLHDLSSNDRTRVLHLYSF